MSDKIASRYKDGRPYDGHKMFLGGGIRRSCARCHQHFPSNTLRKWRGSLMACQKCRGEAP